MIATFLLLGSIAWWLFLADWVILTIYKSKGSMSLLRGYCLFQEMRPYLKVYAFSNKEAQEIIRSFIRWQTGDSNDLYYGCKIRNCSPI